MSDERSRQQHPDADLLAGFAENSLTQHEQESVLSHLAVCSRCLQVVFLAHQVEPTPDTQASNLKPRPFWRRNWFPLLVSASAGVVLAVITFSWYGQFHTRTTPQDSEIAQQRTAPMPSGNESASKATKTPEVTPPPPPTAAAPKDGTSAAKPYRQGKPAQQEVPSSLPSTAFDSVGTPGNSARKLTEEAPHAAPRRDQKDEEEAQQASARRDRMELGLNSATQRAQSTGVMQSAPGSNAGSAGYSPRAIQPGKVSRQTRDAWDAPPSGGAVTTSQANRPEWSAPAAEPSQPPESKQVHAEGCVEPGVEAGCLIVKDRQSGKLYHVLIKGLRPQLGDGIEFTGVPHDGPTSCMQGIPLDVITWVDKSSLKCAQAEAPKK